MLSSVLFSSYDEENKKTILGAYFIILFIQIMLIVIRYRIKNHNIHIWIYLAISLINISFIAIASSDKYITTTSVGIVAFTVILYHTFSRKILAIQAVVTIGIMLYWGILADGKTIEIGPGYVVTLVSMYMLITAVFFIGIKMYNKFENIYKNKIEEINEANIELQALNEEYYATEEELRYKYDEVEKLNMENSSLNNFLTSIIKVVEDGFLTYNVTSGEATFYNGLDKKLGIENFKVIDNLPNIVGFVDKKYIPIFIEKWENVFSGKKKYDEDIILFTNGDKKFYLRISMLKTKSASDCDIIVISVKDKTKQKESENKIKYNLYHDRLTGSLNLDGFIKHVDKMIEEGNFDFKVVLFDIDNFGYINNSFGYDIGDKILQEVIEELQRKEFGISNVARVEGDTMLFTIGKNKELYQIERIIKRTLGNIVLEGIDIKINASIGVIDAEESYTASRLFRNAEITMYKVKEAGKCKIDIYDEEYHKKMDRKYKIFRVFDDGIKNNEFINVYQPKVNINTNRLEGFEALVRWKSAELGPVYPNEFIELAEQTGKIIELGYVIMKNAMKFTAKAAKKDDSIVVSINLSPRQLLEEDFISKVVHFINVTGVKIKNIAFEITETAYIENLYKVQEILNELRNIGIEIHLDDFGTGYSSLSYLHKMPINVIKIDKAFVDQIHISEQSRELLSSIIMFAKVLGLKSLAEGVENNEQLEILKEYKCNSIQGYIFDKPLSEEEALEKVNNIYNVS